MSHWHLAWLLSIKHFTISTQFTPRCKAVSLCYIFLSAVSSSSTWISFISEAIWSGVEPSLLARLRSHLQVCSSNYTFLQCTPVCVYITWCREVSSWILMLYLLSVTNISIIAIFFYRQHEVVRVHACSVHLACIHHFLVDTAPSAMCLFHYLQQYAVHMQCFLVHRKH